MDSWFEYRFRHGDADHRPLPVVGFALTTFSLTVGLFVLLAVATGLGYRLLGATGAWPLVIALVAVLANLIAALGERLVRQSEQPIADEQLAGNLAGLASRFNLPELRFAMTETVSALGPGREAPNAYSAGLGFSRRVVVTKALTEEPDEVRDFVVSHELSHVSGRHLAVQLVVTMAASVALIAMVWILMATGQPWNWFGVDPADPYGLPVTVLVGFAALAVLGPVAGWIARAQERLADAGAVAVLGPLSAVDARRLYVASTADLRPPWWARLYALHPAPAERLEFLARQRRSAKNR